MNARMVGAILAATLLSLTIAYAARWFQLNRERAEEQKQVSAIQAVEGRRALPDGWFSKQSRVEEAERHAEALAQIERDWWRRFVIVWLVVAAVPMMLASRTAQRMPDDEHLAA